MTSEIEWNKCIYKDCMNEENGLPTLEDKSIDLCITDPPYNVEVAGTHRGGDSPLFNKKIRYFDNMPQNKYLDWCFKWFDELKRICNIIILTPGYRNFLDWIRKYNDLQFAIWYDKSKQGGCKIASFNKIDPIIIWNLENQRKQHKRLSWNIIEYIFRCNQFNYGDFIHPCPKPLFLWYKIISKIKPESVIDPFLGSGTTAEVCTKLGIKWLGYELNEVYSQDINKRLKNCKREPRQIDLEVFK